MNKKYRQLYTTYQDLWHCKNPSGQETVMTGIINKHVLPYVSKKKGERIRRDKAGNLFIGNFDRLRPCIVAHMDSVHDEKPKKVKMSNGRLKAKNGIGGDDKCGLIAGIEIFKVSDGVNLLFTTEEESGGTGATAIDSDELKNVQYFIEIDRKGHNEVINNSGGNQIASDKMLSDLKPIMKSWGYTTGHGTFTDVNILTKTAGKSAINVSAGYYNAHTNSEYVVLADLYRSIQFVSDILYTIGEVYIWDKSQDSFSIMGYGLRRAYSDYHYTGLDSNLYDPITGELYDPDEEIDQSEDIQTLIWTCEGLGYNEQLIDAISKAYSLGISDGIKTGNNQLDFMK